MTIELILTNAIFNFSVGRSVPLPTFSSPSLRSSMHQKVLFKLSIRPQFDYEFSAVLGPNPSLHLEWKWQILRKRGRAGCQGIKTEAATLPSPPCPHVVSSHHEHKDDDEFLSLEIIYCTCVTISNALFLHNKYSLGTWRLQSSHINILWSSSPILIFQRRIREAFIYVLAEFVR